MKVSTELCSLWKLQYRILPASLSFWWLPETLPILWFTVASLPSLTLGHTASAPCLGVLFFYKDTYWDVRSTLIQHDLILILALILPAKSLPNKGLLWASGRTWIWGMPFNSAHTWFPVTEGILNSFLQLRSQTVRGRQDSHSKARRILGVPPALPGPGVPGPHSWGHSSWAHGPGHLRFLPSLHPWGNRGPVPWDSGVESGPRSKASAARTPRLAATIIHWSPFASQTCISHRKLC